MKHRLTHRAVLALAVCVTCVLAFGVTLAQAVTDANLGGDNELVVNLADAQTDVQNAGAQVNVYRIATGSKDANYDTYNYTFDVEPFTSLGEGYDPKTMTSDSWQSMAQAAQAIVASQGTTPVATAPAGDTITGLTNGLYLVLIPDASSQQYTYSFTPAIVALPGKVGADGAAVYNTADGRWTNTDPKVPVQMVAKWSMSELYGSLQINKTVTGFSGSPATFVFHIVDAETGGQVYEGYAAVQYTSEGEHSTTVGHIPAGLELVVTEEDSGSRFVLTSENGQTATIEPSETATVSFTNSPIENGRDGHGIENHFVFDENYNGGDWRLDVRAIDKSEYVTNY